MPNESSLNNSEKIDVLKFISKTNRKIHEGRIKRELHVVITTLSFYGVALALKLKFPEKLPKDQLFSIIVFGAFLGIAFGVYVYMWTSGKANNYNQKQSEVAEDQMKELLRGSSINVVVNPDHPCANRWLWQALIVIFGAIISGFIIVYF